MESDDNPGASDEDKDRRLYEVMSSAIDHLADQTNFGVSLIVAGDPEVLADETPLAAGDLGDELWRVVGAGASRSIAVGRRGAGDGPWLLVMRSSDGPLEKALIQPDIWTDEASSETVRELVLPSGRLVVGDPETVSRWGPGGRSRRDHLDRHHRRPWRR